MYRVLETIVTLFFRKRLNNSKTFHENVKEMPILALVSATLQCAKNSRLQSYYLKKRDPC